jgi:hypothetical protein
VVIESVADRLADKATIHRNSDAETSHPEPSGSAFEPTPRGTMLAPGAHVTFAPLCAALPVGPDGRSVADAFPGATVYTLRVYRAHALWDLVHIGPTFRVPD